MKYLIFIFLWLPLAVISQITENYYDENQLKFDDYIYRDNIKTVQLYKSGLEYSIPFITLGSNEKLHLSFDDLNIGTGTYYYSFIPCNSDWRETNLMPMEYLNGLTEDYFNNYHLSYNTTIQYSHYETELPSNDISFTKSGNYILKVYPDGEPDQPVITRRFYVIENLVKIDLQNFIASAPQDRNMKQEMFVKIFLNQYPMPDIYSNLTIKIQQNGRKDNIKTLEKPTQINSEYINYNHNGDIVFDGGNEFRKLDIRSFKVQSANISNIKFDTNSYQIDLLNDASRNNKKYINYIDINGKFGIIDWDDVHLNSSIESDYGMVHFYLPVSKPFADGDVFLLGDFTNWRFDKNAKLNYNYKSGKYESNILLKQGYYDYCYIFVPKNSKNGDISFIEGKFSDTENQYTVFVYYKDQSEVYERIIGFQSFSTNKK